VLLRYFGGRTLQEVTPKTIRAFIGQRLNEGVSEATVNRERPVSARSSTAPASGNTSPARTPFSLVKPFQEPAAPDAVPDSRRGGGPPGIQRRPPAAHLLHALHTGGRLREILSLTWSTSISSAAP